MAETLRFGLPLVAPAQAQKHVTVNEAFQRLDALAQIALVSRSVNGPPESPAEGAAWLVAAGAWGDWTGQAGRIALFLNGGWDFVAPAAGWRAWVADEGAEILCTGAGWEAGVLARSPHGAGAFWRVVEIDHAVTAGAANATALVLPAGAMVFGVTARVVEGLAGTAASWRLGNPGAEDRFGSGLGLGQGGWARGILGAPMTVWDDTPVVLTATGGSFAAGGVVRLAAHYLELTVPGV